MNRILKFFCFFSAVGLLFFPAALLSATTWQGIDLGNWNNADNWDAGIPVDGVEAYINNGTTAVLDTTGPAGAASNVYVGHGGTGNSGLNISNDLTASGYMAVGLSNDVPGSVAGTVNQSDGAVSVATMYIGNTYSFSVATAGVYNMTGGSLDVTTGPFRVGWYGGGTFDQSGGVVTSSAALDIGTGGSSATVTVRGTASMTVSDILMCGPAGSGKTATLNVQGGTLNVPGAIWYSYYFAATNGVINQSGGTVTAAGFASVGGTGTYNLSGGEMNLLYDGGGSGYGSPITTLVMTDGGGGGGTLNIVSPSWLQASNPYDLQAGTVNGALGGSAGLNKSTPGTVTLNGYNSYTGNTTITGGTLVLGAGAWIGSSAQINVQSGILDASAANLYLNASQVLIGKGTILGSVSDIGSNKISGGTLGTPGTLTFNNDLTIFGSALQFDLDSVLTEGSDVNDELIVNGALALYAGSVNVKMIGTIGLAAGSYPLIKYGSYTDPGDLASISLFDESGNPLNSGGASRQSFALADHAPYVTLDVIGTPLSLTWAGTSGSHDWDIQTSSNWTASGPQQFYNLDFVTFNDEGLPSLEVNLVDHPTYGGLSPSAITVDSERNYNFGGTGSLVNVPLTTKNGSGTWTIGNSASNDFGAITVNGGSMVISNTGSDVFTSLTTNGSGTATIGNDGSNTFASPTITVSGGSVVFSNTGSNDFTTLTKDGAGTLTFSNSGGDSFGELLMNQGTVQVDTAVYANNVAVGNSGAGNCLLNITSDLSVSGYLAVGLSSETSGVAGTVNQSAGNVYVDQLFIGSTITDTVAGVYNLTGGTLTATRAAPDAGIVFGYFGSSGTLTLDGGVIQVKNIFMRSSGENLATLNVISGLLNIYDPDNDVYGALWYSEGSSNTHGVINQSGGTINTAGFASYGGEGTYNLSGGEINLLYNAEGAGYGNPITTLIMTDGGGGGGTLNIADPSWLEATNTFDLQAGTVNGILGGDVGLTKSNTGTVTLNGNNTYTGITTVQGGVLSIPAIADGEIPSPIGQSSIDPTNLVLDGGTLYYTGTSATTNRGFSVGPDVGTVKTDNDLTLTGNVIESEANGNLAKDGPGVLTLTGTLSYTGTTTITQGTLQIITSTTSSLRDITGAGELEVGSDTQTTNLSAARVTVGTLSIKAGSKLTIAPYSGGAAAAVPVPEPSAWVLLALAGLGVLMAARRRK